MAFSDGTTELYLPIAASAGASQWGTDVRKLLNVADATQDVTTVCNLGTGGTVRRTCDPYTSTTADLVDADYGFAVTPSDMGSVAGAEREYDAGNHVLSIRTIASIGFVAETKDLIFSAYRVGPAPDRTRTLLGSATGAMNITQAFITLTLALPRITFAPDETIQYGAEMNAGGVAVTGRTVQFVTGSNAAEQRRITTPPLRTVARAVGSASGSGNASGALAATAAVAGSAGGTGDGVGVLAAVATTNGSANGAGTATPMLAGINTANGSASGAGVATGLAAAVGAMAGQSSGQGVALGELARVLPVVGAAAGSGVAAGAAAGLGAMTGSAAGTGIAAGSFGAVSETVGSALGVGASAGAFAAVFGTVGTVDIGAGGTTYPDGLLRLRVDGRVESIPSGSGSPPPGTLRITTVP